MVPTPRKTGMRPKGKPDEGRGPRTFLDIIVAMSAPPLLLAFLLAAAPAGAYQRDEHYLTTRLVLGAREGGDIAALCSQLADEAPELNAIEVYQRLMEHPLDYAAWTLTGNGPDGTVGRFVTVQQMLHGLTGGSPEAVRAVAAETARGLWKTARAEKDPARRTDVQCALGFALHLYGDSFAHQRIKNPALMYRTGIGHLFDGAKPDMPLCTPERMKLWRGYLASAPGLIPEGAIFSFESMFFSASASQLKARRANDYAREELMRAEAEALRGGGVIASPLARNLANHPCQKIADAAAKGLPRAPTCEGAWTIYREAAARAFAAYDADPAHADKPVRSTRRAWFEGSPFSKGAAW